MGLGEEEGKALVTGWHLCADEHHGFQEGRGELPREGWGGASGLREGMCLASGTMLWCLFLPPTGVVASLGPLVVSLSHCQVTGFTSSMGQGSV